MMQKTLTPIPALEEPITSPWRQARSKMVDAGIIPHASISDFVWTDSDGDGIQDPGENGLPGVVVILNDDTGTEIARDTTDANGNYLFDELLPGDYTVEVVLPPNSTHSPAGQGSDPTKDSDVNPTTGETATISLAAGEDNSDIDAGIIPYASISDFVWEDTNGDGDQDAGENGKSGVVVVLYDDMGTEIARDTTDGNGNYSFDELMPGDYTVGIELPAGYISSPLDQGGDDAKDSDIDPATGETATINLTAGENDDSVDAGLVPTGSIGDMVWEDTDGDGIQDPGETSGIPGVIVTLYDDMGTEVAKDTTDSNGNYLFEDVPPGDYTLNFNTPTGATLSPQDQGGNDNQDSDPDPSTGTTGTVTVTPGQDRTDVDAGATFVSSIGDFVWTDSDGDGVQGTGEMGLPGVEVTLYNSTGVVVAKDTTDANGEYEFINVIPGTYSVGFDLPANSQFSPKDQGGDDAKDSDPNTGTGRTDNFALASSQVKDDVDAGIIPYASISDFVWEDNGNGIQDPGENGLPGVVVILNDDTGAEIARDTTDANGNYLFDELLPGDYTVEVVLPPNSIHSPAGQGSDPTKDSDVNPTTGETATISLAAGENNGDIDAGIIKLALISDFVWEDTDGDGIQDMGESGLPGIEVTLYNNSGVAVAKDTTDANGFYSFTDLTPGNYTVGFATPTGYVISPQSQGGDTAKDSDPSPNTGKTATINLQGSDVRTDIDAGMGRVGSIGNFVWEDTDADGIQDSGEPGFPGVVVTLYDKMGNVVAKDTTDANGEYWFDLLSPGDYTVGFTTPNGESFGPKDRGTDDGKDSDVNPSTGRTDPFTLTSGQSKTDIDASVLKDTQIGNFVWNDTDRDGIQDPGEMGVSGVVVYLLDPAFSILKTDTTDANGEFTFDKVSAGNYRLQFVNIPSGYVFSPKDQGTDDEKDSDPNVGTGVTDIFSVSANQSDLSRDAGIYQRTTMIGDRVWQDTDADGFQDSGEPGLPGVIVTLYNSTGGVVATDTTDANGNYIFTGMPAGDYTVGFSNVPAGYVFSPKDIAGNTRDTQDSDANPTTGRSGTISIAAGQSNTTVDAGLIPSGSIGDRVWTDTDYDGIQDPRGKRDARRGGDSV